MARENFLWGAPRIHGELLMLGFTVSQATVSCYMPPANRRSGQSWRTFIRNQAMAFGHRELAEERLRGSAGLHIESNWNNIKRSGAAQITVLRKNSEGASDMAHCFHQSGSASASHHH
jgi:hypothetical protein